MKFDTGAARPLTHGQLGGESRIHVDEKGIKVTDTDGVVQVEIGKLADGRYGIVLPEGSVTVGSLADGSITGDKLADEAVTTPKLDSDAVIKNLENTPGEVVIDSTGVEITNGALTLVGPDSTVIIDGTSNMFKIAASGTISVTETGGGSADAVGPVSGLNLSSLGTYTTPPQFLSMIKSYPQGGSALIDARSTSFYVSGGSVGGIYEIILMGYIVAFLEGDNTLRLSLHVTNNSGTTRVYQARYYVLEEAGI